MTHIISENGNPWRIMPRGQTSQQGIRNLLPSNIQSIVMKSSGGTLMRVRVDVKRSGHEKKLIDCN
jgi:hypothetical protein